MEILELFLLIVLLIAAVFIIAAVLMQKSNEEGLSGTIAGGADTFYGKDKSTHGDRTLFKWTVIASLVFAFAVIAVYIIQPDYSSSFSLGDWMSDYLNNYSHIFPAD